jgi:hypothetical protein
MPSPLLHVLVNFIRFVGHCNGDPRWPRNVKPRCASTTFRCAGARWPIRVQTFQWGAASHNSCLECAGDSRLLRLRGGCALFAHRLRLDRPGKVDAGMCRRVPCISLSPAAPACVRACVRACIAGGVSAGAGVLQRRAPPLVQAHLRLLKHARTAEELTSGLRTAGGKGRCGRGRGGRGSDRPPPHPLAAPNARVQC